MSGARAGAVVSGAHAGDVVSGARAGDVVSGARAGAGSSGAGADGGLGGARAASGAGDVPLPGGGTMVRVERGEAPLLIGLPHTGTHVPGDVWEGLNEAGRALTDTDWRVERLFEGLAPGAGRVRMCVHRYVVDANRPPDGASLYPGLATTGLVPETDFDGRPIWTSPPDAAEVERRRATFHAPYHAALAAELGRLRARHGHAVLLDAHSIRSRVPRLFEGRLPDLNVGTDGGATCHPEVEAIVADGAAASPHSSVLNGRFRGGWTTRHHGRAPGIHAVQLEIAQSAYLAAEAPPWDYDEDRGARLRATLAPILGALAAWRPPSEEPR